MGIKLQREKKRLLITSIFYRMIKLPLSSNKKLKLFLNLEWIFSRLAHEMSFKIYSPQTHPIRNYAKKFLLDVLDEQQSVLDLGCGSGDVSNIIAEKARTVVGIDHNEESLKIASDKYKRSNLTFIHEDARTYLKTSDKFDVLILSHILEHLDDPKDFLQTFKDYFEYVYIEVPDFDRDVANHYRKDLNMELIYSDNDHVSEFDRYELKDLINLCNLEILREEYIFGVQRYWCKV
ncbi:MAG: class I SAM-dependent methyltransferase [Pyrinomonadaceae bacterium]|nr:class I SAM-dependent methyltransferase [Pyrinomonadaceae bacterium]